MLPAKKLPLDIRIEFLQHVETGIEAKLYARALGNVGKISLTLGIIGYCDRRGRKTAQNFRDVERPSPGILTRHQDPAHRISHPMGEISIAKAIVAWVLAQKRRIHTGNEDAGGQAVGKSRTISFAVTFR